MKRDLDQVLQAELAGARLRLEKSNALPQSYYGDPARHVKLQAEQACGGCVYSRPGVKGEFCSKGKAYGISCDAFKKQRKGNK